MERAWILTENGVQPCPIQSRLGGGPLSWHLTVCRTMNDPWVPRWWRVALVSCAQTWTGSPGRCCEACPVWPCSPKFHFQCPPTKYNVCYSATKAVKQWHAIILDSVPHMQFLPVRLDEYSLEFALQLVVDCIELWTLFSPSASPSLRLLRKTNIQRKYAPKVVYGHIGRKYRNVFQTAKSSVLPLASEVLDIKINIVEDRGQN